ncbi:hypothetical protein CFC21_087206 [Triticum aestivum]|uniref:DUF4220 domain-containing protein n=3 Tax=Triticum TaxID=4564 RepID=A0A9R0YHA2_TRITD|nr:uncharacterized protein LOC123133764 [Triticum aestivum]KAF7083408.1 hypothetical protein CFC21_087206 [Triticum aestivum]VAI54969.1 unnamed protein product [Triticum turgidum subsp. durum]
MSADSVAIFILGHLSVHASGPRHQLLFLWAPFVLLHLGGQQTITAFSMKDNELWRRHLLGLVTQVVVAGYVVTRPSWADKRLLAAMMLLFISGCLRYGGRTLCLYRASPAKLKEFSLDALRSYVPKVEKDGEATRSGSFSSDGYYEDTIHKMLIAHRRDRPYHDSISSSTAALVSDTPLSGPPAAEVSPDIILHKLQVFKDNAVRTRAYYYIGDLLVHIYQRLYTKAPLHSLLRHKLFVIFPFEMNESRPGRLSIAILFHLSFSCLLVIFPIISTSATLVLVAVAQKSQLYSQADVIVSYILLIGALALDVASVFAMSEEACYLIRSLARGILHPWGARQYWSEMVRQYNMINSLTKKDATKIMPFVAQWISKRLDDKTVTHIPINDNLKRFVLDKLLEFGTRQEDWNFASFHGQLALRDWSHWPSSTRAETYIYKSIHGEDFPTTVLIWHIATDILYLQDDTNSTNSDQQTKKVSRELSNYIMYLVFKCGVMLTNTTELQHNNALKTMEAHRGLDEQDAMEKVFLENRVQMSTPKTLISPVLPRACKVAQELIHIHREVGCWDLIAAVWLEMICYIAPRCGGAFHSEHLATGGELITHVLLMQLLGPFLKLQGISENDVLIPSESVPPILAVEKSRLAIDVMFTMVYGATNVVLYVNYLVFLERE